MPTQKERDFQSIMNSEVTTEVSVDALSNAIDFISSNYDPDDIFSQKDLEAWAENNGYIKE
jgi:hypothetical protein